MSGVLNMLYESEVRDTEFTNDLLFRQEPLSNALSSLSRKSLLMTFVRFVQILLVHSSGV